MKEVERVGLLKMDFLGLSTLTLIRDALTEIKRTEGIDLDIDAVPLDDAKTYQLFVDGQTYGIFQFESSGMRDILRKAKPQRLDDLIALNALYRPGPLKSGMVDDFIARKAGKSEVKYELPQLEPILAETYGVIAYQEQVMRIASRRRRVQPRRGRHPAQGDGEEERRGDGGAARRASSRARPARRSTKRRPPSCSSSMEHFAGYGFHEVALDDLCAARLPDGVPEGELPAPLRGGAAHHRSGQHRQARALHRRVPRSRHRRSSRRTSTRATCTSPSCRAASASA